MAEPLIKSVNRPPRVQDPLHKPDGDKKRKPPPRKGERRKKDPKHIIDTYA